MSLKINVLYTLNAFLDEYSKKQLEEVGIYRKAEFTIIKKTIFGSVYLVEFEHKFYSIKKELFNTLDLVE